jgi:hypothetical protein
MFHLELAIFRQGPASLPHQPDWRMVDRPAAAGIEETLAFCHFPLKITAETRLKRGGIIPFSVWQKTAQL